MSSEHVEQFKYRGTAIVKSTLTGKEAELPVVRTSNPDWQEKGKRYLLDRECNPDIILEIPKGIELPKGPLEIIEQ